MSEEIRVMMRQVVAEVSKGNWDALDKYLESDFVYHMPPFADIRGLAVFKRFMGNQRTSFPDIQWAIDEMIVEGNIGVARLTLHGTNTGQSKFFPFPPTGKKVTWTCCMVSRIVGGKVTESWNYIDNLGMMQQLGVIPSIG
jgi:predicted ester cyclase